MKEFDLKLAIKEPSKLFTRNGRPARILSTNVKSDRPLVVAIKNISDDKEEIFCYKINGKINASAILNPLDLVIATTKHKGWVNIIALMGAKVVDSNIYKTKEAALEAAKENDFCITTTELTWEE